MQKTILNYLIRIEKEKMGGKNIYNAYCSALGLADYGKTLDEAVKRITDLIKFHIESLQELGHSVPVEKESTTVLTSVEIPISSSRVKLSYV